MTNQGFQVDPINGNDAGYAKQQVVADEPALWRAVLLQSLKDATGSCCGTSGKAAIRARHDAQQWFLNGNEDFKRVCEYAGYDPQRLQEGVLEWLTNPASDYKAVMFQQTQMPTQGAKRGRPKKQNHPKHA